MEFNTVYSTYKKCRFYAFLVLASLITALIFLFINKNISFVFITIAALCHLCLFRPLQKKYSDIFTECNITKTICKVLNTNQTIKTPCNGITSETISRAELMPMREGKGMPLLCWYVSGNKSGLPIELCDATICQDFQLQENGKNRVHFNSGVWIHINLPKDTNKNFRIIDETAVPTPIRMKYFSEKLNYRTIAVPDHDLAEKFVLYQPISKTENQLSEEFLYALKKLSNYTPGYLALSINGSSFDLFIRGRFLGTPVSINKVPTKESLEFNPFPEIEYVIKLAKSL